MVCPTPAQQIVFQEYVRAVNEHTARLQRLEQERKDHVQTWRLAPVVDALQALRGVQCTVAVTMVAERRDLTRFENPRQLMHYLGLTPSEYSTGARRRQGGMTKTGNTHARRALIEGAWAYRYPAKVSRQLQLRLEKVPKPLQDLSWKAQVRLCKRDRRLIARGKNANQVVVAIARDLRACMWVIAQEAPLTPETETIASPASVLSKLRPSIGRDAAPVWCSPRRRYEAERNPPSSIEAGTRRTHVRWYPIHGYQRDQPSSLTGSGSSDGRRAPGRLCTPMKKMKTM